MAKRSSSFRNANSEEEERLRRAIARGAGLAEARRLVELLEERSRRQQDRSSHQDVERMARAAASGDVGAAHRLIAALENNAATKGTPPPAWLDDSADMVEDDEYESDDVPHYIRVEYDPNYAGGDYDRIGSYCYLLDTEDLTRGTVEKKFSEATGLGEETIVSYNFDELFVARSSIKDQDEDE